jgi:hypothetical protein
MEIRIINKDINKIANGDPKILKLLKENSTAIDVDLIGRSWIRKVMGVHAYIPTIKLELGTFLLDKITELITGFKI